MSLNLLCTDCRCECNDQAFWNHCEVYHSTTTGFTVPFVELGDNPPAESFLIEWWKSVTCDVPYDDMTINNVKGDFFDISQSCTLTYLREDIYEASVLDLQATYSGLTELQARAYLDDYVPPSCKRFVYRGTDGEGNIFDLTLGSPTRVVLGIGPSSTLSLRSVLALRSATDIEVDPRWDLPMYDLLYTPPPGMGDGYYFKNPIAYHIASSNNLAATARWNLPVSSFGIGTNGFASGGGHTCLTVTKL